MKTCARCKQEKQLDDFCKDRKKPDGLFIWCRQCSAEHRKNRIGNPVTPEKQKCNRCDEIFPCTPEFFQRAATNYTGFQYECKPCKASRRNNYRNEYGALGGDFIEYKIVFERDSGICGICSEVVDATLSRRSRLGGTIDHIMPLSRGGRHTYQNVQLAHKGCNSAKRDKVA